MIKVQYVVELYGEQIGVYDSVSEMLDSVEGMSYMEMAFRRID